MILRRRWLHDLKKFNFKIHYDIIGVKPVKPSYNSTWLNINDITPHFILEIKTKGFYVIGVNVFLRKKRGLNGPYYTAYQQLFKINFKRFKVSQRERPH